MDLMGPVQPLSLAGSQYIATYYDDFSKLSYVQPLANKSQVVEASIDVIKLLERQSGHQLKAIRTDNGN